LINTIVK